MIRKLVLAAMISVAATAAQADSEASQTTQSLSGLNLLETVAITAGTSGYRQGFWFCQNQSAATIYVALDDGNGGALSVYVLDPSGQGVGHMGGAVGSNDVGPFTGRIRVYGTAGSQHSMRVQ